MNGAVGKNADSDNGGDKAESDEAEDDDANGDHDDHDDDDKEEDDLVGEDMVMLAGLFALATRSAAAVTQPQAVPASAPPAASAETLERPRGSEAAATRVAAGALN
eukprot:s4874_g3.t1